MATKRHKPEGVAAFEKAAKAAKAAAPHRRYELRLYVAGVSPRSAAAIRAISEICEEHLRGRCELQVIDIYQQPTLAKGEQIVAVPTLIRKVPAPLRRFIGDLADKERILVGLDLRPKG